MNSYIQLGLDLGLLEKFDMSIGGQKFTGYAILNKTADPVLNKTTSPVFLSGLSQSKEVTDRVNKDFRPDPPVKVEDKNTIGVETIKKMQEAWRLLPTNPPPPFPPGLQGAGIESALVNAEASSGINTGPVTVSNESNVPAMVPVAVPPLPAPTQEQLDAQAALARMTGQAPPAEPKKRGRPKKQTEAFTLAPAEVIDPKAAPAVLPVTESTPVESQSAPSTVGESKTLEQWQAAPVEEPKVEPKPIIEGLPSTDEVKIFRSKLTHYADDVLPPAGLVPSEGIGGVRMKIKLFIQKKFGVEDTKYLKTEQWKDLLDFFETQINSFGAPALVEHINKEIGA